MEENEEIEQSENMRSLKWLMTNASDPFLFENEIVQSSPGDLPVYIIKIKCLKRLVRMPRILDSKNQLNWPAYSITFLESFCFYHGTNINFLKNKESCSKHSTCESIKQLIRQDGFVAIEALIKDSYQVKNEQKNKKRKIENSTIVNQCHIPPSFHPDCVYKNCVTVYTSEGVASTLFSHTPIIPKVIFLIIF